MNFGEKGWQVIFHDAFSTEFDALPENIQDELLAALIHLRHSGPTLGRPYADTLYGAKNSNLKELRFEVSNGIWRVAFAFDPRRQAIILVAGDKKGENQKKFYKRLIKVADSRFDEWLSLQKD
jgi:hypothetical protein